MQIEPSESAFAETYGRGQAQVVWCTLVADLDKEYAISIDGIDIVPTNFKSIEAIDRLLLKYRKP